MTGGRLKAIRPYLDEDEPFCFTYGDGLATVDIGALIAFHSRHGKQATITAVAPPGRFGALEFSGDLVTHFREKPAGDGGRINGGFFVASPSVLDLVSGWDTVWEKEPSRRWRHRASSRLSTTRVLASDGYAPRQGRVGGDVGERDRALEDLVGANVVLARQTRFSHRPHRLQGRMACLVADRPRRGGDGVLPRATDDAQSLRACADRGSRAARRRRRSRRDRLGGGGGSSATRGGYSPGRPIPGSRLLRRSGGDLCGQRHGDGEPSGGGAPDRGCALGDLRHQRQML